jgi:membrane associated rhomboid family serine protease
MAANSLAYQFKTSSIVTKLIVINVLLFLFINLFPFFFGISQVQMVAWLVLPDDFSEFILQPWSILSYGFLHFGFFHLLFNMLWLYWFGEIILNLFNSKRFLTVYLLGVIFGGFLYLLAYNFFPVFEGSRAYLLGASGAVMAIILFIATYTPNAEIRIIFFTIKLWQLALFLFLFDLIRLPASNNAGGLLAHVGGAIFGYIYARQLAKGNDIGLWFERIMDWVANLFTPRKAKPFKKVHRTPSKGSGPKTSEDKSAHQRKVDAILDKIGKSGYDSLTKEEKDFLFKAGKE